MTIDSKTLNQLLGHNPVEIEKSQCKLINKLGPDDSKKVTAELTPSEKKRLKQREYDLRYRAKKRVEKTNELKNETPRSIVEKKPVNDQVNNPPHYTSHPSGIECIQVTEHMGFNLGNATKYIWWADLKGNAIEDLEKAAWYIRREIERRRSQIETIPRTVG